MNEKDPDIQHIYGKLCVPISLPLSHCQIINMPCFSSTPYNILTPHYHPQPEGCCSTLSTCTSSPKSCGWISGAYCTPDLWQHLGDGKKPEAPSLRPHWGWDLSLIGKFDGLEKAWETGMGKSHTGESQGKSSNPETLWISTILEARCHFQQLMFQITVRIIAGHLHSTFASLAFCYLIIYSSSDFPHTFK